jgi:hypothetical protein
MECFEKRIERKLSKNDLTKCFVNEKINKATIAILNDYKNKSLG